MFVGDQASVDIERNGKRLSEYVKRKTGLAVSTFVATPAILPKSGSFTAAISRPRALTATRASRKESMPAATAAPYYEVMALVDQLSYAGNEAARRYLNGAIDRDGAAAWLECRRLDEPHTEAAYDTCFAEVVAAAGDVDSGPLVLGVSPAATGFFIAGARQAGDGEIVDRLLDGVVAKVREQVPWRPGAVELLAALNAAGVPCGAALTVGQPRHNRTGSLFEGIEIWSERVRTLTPADVKARAATALTVANLRNVAIRNATQAVGSITVKL